MILLETTEILKNLSIWDNTFFYLFGLMTITLVVIILISKKLLRNRKIDYRLLQQQHVAKINNIRNEYHNNTENLRIEMLKREGERVRQWEDSEKETLHVLNGVSNLLDLTNTMGRVDSNKILSKLSEIEGKIEKIRINI